MKLPRFCLIVLVGMTSSWVHADDALLPHPAALQPAVDFWIRVYTQITTNDGFIHDQQNLSIVYETLHFDPDMGASAREREVDAEKQHFHDILLHLASGAAPTDAQERQVLALWGAAGTPLRLEQAAEDVRFQLGQADRFRAGLVRAGAWQHHIAQVFAREGLPPELAALPDVESSFDPAARSKVGAAGLWQFMRSTGRRFLRINAALDERLDPFRETEAAAQLLAYNYRLLGSWPLAITAYNHGAAGMMRAREQLGTDDIVTILRNYHSPTFGFASRNFYVSFLAALTVAQHPERYFGELRADPQIDFREVRLPRAANLPSLARTLGVSEHTLQRLNPALRPAVWSGRRAAPAGYLLRLPDQEESWTPARLAQRLESGSLVAVAAAAPGAASSGARPAHLRAAQRLTAAPLTLTPTTNFLHASDDGPRGAAASLASEDTSLFAAQATGASADLASQPSTADYYFVQPGDTINSIAVRSGLPAAQLLALNGLPGQDFLYPGERLRLAPSVPEPGVTDSPALTELTQQGVQEKREDQQAVLLASHQQPAEPVSAAQAEAAGPQLGPGASGLQWSDPVDYAVESDGTIQVVAAETLGHYAEWLDITPARLRELNHLRGRTPVLMGRRLKLDFGKVTPAQFEQRRRDYHQNLEAQYFAAHRIVGTTVYVARRGDSLWNITRHDARVPVWLLQQYNPQIDIGNLRPGTQVAVPKVEEVTL